MDYWNHNTAYYDWIKKETAMSFSVLDVGCGDGTLIEYLNDGSKELLGIDNYQFCIDRASRQHKTENTDFLCLDYEDFVTAKKFDAIIFAASIHHMNMRNAIEKSVSLLNEGGILLIVGLAKPSSIIDYTIEGLRVIPCSVISKIKHLRSNESESIPVSYEFPSMSEVRNIANELLHGYTIKYGLFYRFLLKWVK